tara:strand:- start:1041 stop:1199 length:159 start_codon:yes stop_codon:yes gene_type:complete
MSDNIHLSSSLLGGKKYRKKRSSKRVTKRVKRSTKRVKRTKSKKMARSRRRR